MRRCEADRGVWKRLVRGLSVVQSGLISLEKGIAVPRWHPRVSLVACQRASDDFDGGVRLVLVLVLEVFKVKVSRVSANTSGDEEASS